MGSGKPIIDGVKRYFKIKRKKLLKKIKNYDIIYIRLKMSRDKEIKVKWERDYCTAFIKKKNRDGIKSIRVSK